ncbi:MAG: PKD domain-containing protein [Candidatus Eisenbacteria bacterium]|nr:PKD domain-containing protein [Candidatus Eisenbacteria bacterium]
MQRRPRMSPRSHPSPADVCILALFAILTMSSAQAADRQGAGTPAAPGLTLRAQGPSGLELHYAMGDFGMEAVDLADGTFQKVTLPGVILPNDPGAPDLPGLGRFVAIPQGAAASFEIIAERTEVYPNIDIAPAPVLPREGDDGPLVYERDLAIYQRDALYPTSPVVLSDVRQMRGVDVVTLGITPFQYNPVTRELIVYRELEVRVDFTGGTGQFGEPRYRNRHWEPVLAGHLINYESLPRFEGLPQADPGGLRGDRDGYEYVIICPDHSDFIAWSDSLASWRKLQGISSAVYTTTDIGGTSASAIEDFLDNAYSNWATPPAAFLIVGDYPGSEVSVGVASPIWSNYCVSDNIYADVDGDDLPEMFHGRITARNATDLASMVGKMLAYERAPYTDAGFYDHPIMAGGWQTERWFILCTEVIFGHQANVLGKSPIREYAIYSGTPGSVWSTATNTSTVVDYFGPNGLGYIPSTPSHLTDWGGSATRINNDINAGSYLMLHRDHGYEYGWGEPDYDKYDLDGLMNSMLPFVMSINCLTAKYDYGAETFTEKFHRMGQGALGLIGASEVSYSFVNDTFVWGVFDSMWPDFDPGYNDRSIGQDDLRTAVAHASGKYYLEASSWPYNTSSKDVTYNLFHHHGDAFMTLYSEVPQNLAVSHDSQLLTGATSFTAQADGGAVIALTVNGEIVGVADATGSSQQIPVTPQTQAGTLRVTITKANYYRYVSDVPIIEETPPVVTDFSGNPTSGCAPLTVAFTDLSAGDVTTWDWDFGDGGTSTAQNPAHDYLNPGTYTVSLTASGPEGSDVETKTDYVTVSGGPAADFVGSPLTGGAPLTVAFTDLSTEATGWSWDFGDGAGTSTAQNPTYEYTAEGIYTVTLTATNACGSDQEVKTDYITVTAPQPYAFALSDLPVAGTVTGSYLDTHASDDVREAITEVNSGTHPRKWYSTLEHRWEFDVTAGSAITFHLEASRTNNSENDDFAFEYSTNGSSWEHIVTVANSSEQSYDVSLPETLSGTVFVRVVDTDHTRDNQSFDTVSIDYMMIESTVGPVPPTADFVGDPTSGFAPLTVQFTDQSSGSPTSWSWDFGDGGTSTGQSPAHEYVDPGTYSVTLTVTNANGTDAEQKLDYISVAQQGEQLMHVHEMVVTRKNAGPNVSGRCTVTIVDVGEAPVEGATVSVSWDGPNSGSDSGLTASDGTVTMETRKVRNPSGEWCFEVTDVAHATYSYDPTANNVTRACESGPIYLDGELEIAELRIGLQPAAVEAADGARWIRFQIPQAGHTRLDIFNVAGQKVATLVDGWLDAGRHTAVWEAGELPSGIYFYHLRAGAAREARKVMIVH